MKWKFVLEAAVGIVLSMGALSGQSNPGDFAVTYGANYSSKDRKATAEPGTVVPGSFSYRPTCSILLGLDDDSFVSNKTSAGTDTGTGDLAFEGHWTFWRGFQELDGNCAASKRDSFRLDYVATVPVPNTLETTELTHQVKVTFNHPHFAGVGLVSDLFINAGFTVSGLATGGNTTYGLASANYLRNFHAGGAWGIEGEVDLASHSKLAPSSASLLLAIDGALDKAQIWTIRFGSSFGVTPYAPKVSPFLQLTYNGTFKHKRVE